MSLEEWKRRYTPRIFDNTSSVSQQDVEELIELIKYIPNQNGKHYHTWVVLSEKHKHIKKWLIENIFYIHQGSIKEHMIQIYTAPIVFCGFYEPKGPGPFQSEANRSIGLHAAAIGQKALTQGHDVAFLSCIGEPTEYEFDQLYKSLNNESLESLNNKNLESLPQANQNHEIMKRGFTEILVNNFETQLKELYGEKFFQFFPIMCLCIGKGLKIPRTNKHFTIFDGYTYYQKQKPKKIYIM